MKMLFNLPYASITRLKKMTLNNHQGSLERPSYLLVDVSIISGHDAGTGIQRVVRSIASLIAQISILGYDIRFVAATRKKPYRPIAYASRPALPVDEMRALRDGDLFLGLDFCSAVLPANRRQIRQWRKRGVRCHYLVYDLLPQSNPEWFTPKSVQNYRRWFRFVTTTSDGLLCISQHVRNQLESSLAESGARSVRTATIRLSGDVGQATRVGTEKLPSEITLAKVNFTNFILMVGTIEPRKGYDDALDIYQHVLEKMESAAPQLVIVGRPGWKSDATQNRLRRLSQSGHIIWLDDACDVQLQLLYDRCKGVFYTSLGEGFGLPLAESLKNRKPAFARNLEVFQEFSDKNVTFFENRTAQAISQKMINWISELNGYSFQDSSENLNPECWMDATKAIVDFMVYDNSHHQSHN